MGAAETVRTAREPGARGVGREWAPTWLRALLAHRRGFALARWVAVASLVGCTAPLTVDRLDDEPTASACVEGVPDDCSLRGAILAANAHAGLDVVIVPAGTYTLTIDGRAEDEGLTGDLDIRDSLDLIGQPSDAGERPLIQGWADRLVDLGPTPSPIDVTFENLRFRGGHAESEASTRAGGGAIRNRASGLRLLDCEVSEAESTDDGGAVFNAGSLYLLRSTVTTSRSYYGMGGGIANEGSVVLEDARVADNAIGCLAASVAYGGGIFAGAFSETSLIRSVVSGNTITWGGWDIILPGAHCEGGGITSLGSLYVDSSEISGNALLKGTSGDTLRGAGIASQGTLVIENSTFAGNNISTTAGARGGGAIWSSGAASLAHVTLATNAEPALWSTAASMTLANSLVAGTCQGLGITSSGGNLESPGDTCQLDPSTDQIAVPNPGLGPLASNGGPTRTVALLAGSPAIDGGIAAVCLPTDQRGEPRTDGHCDIGAYERRPEDS